MKIGITGLQGAGKTTIFRLLTTRPDARRVGNGKLSFPDKSGFANPPNPNIASIDIPDERLDYLANVLQPKKTTYAKIEFIDPPGFTKSSLSSLQVVEGMIYVVNSPESLQELKSELILRDMEICENSLKKSIDPKEQESLEKCKSILSEGKSIRKLELNEAQEKQLRGFGFLTLKPSIVIINVSQDKTEDRGQKTIQVQGKLELEFSELSADEQKEYAKEFNIGEPLLNRFTKEGLPQLNIISFFTTVGQEVRAWQIQEGISIIKAAGKVHSAMEHGFIRAEIIGFENFKQAGSFKEAKEKGLIQTVKQDYIVKDGDIIEFKFN
ncbi:MAG: redox-regulated ATPase YchF [Candidatus Stahlbacteria bacterium]|nr:redox-regulated ATPase YchF [Candidatus Stahlbacteria bacterium]